MADNGKEILMVISIHQPDYIPYIGYYYKISQSDKFVFLDDAQFSSDNMHHWNKIKTPQGECRLKIPVDYSFGDTINQVRTKDELKWKEKHLKTIEMNYSKAPFFKDVFPQFKDVLMHDYDNLAEMNIALTELICDGFGLNVVFLKSSDLNLSTSREEKVIDICIDYGADTYLSGNGARAYQVEEHFTSKNIQLEYSDYSPIEYKQQWGDFIPNLSVIDFIFNCGFDMEYIKEKVKGGKSGNR